MTIQLDQLPSQNGFAAPPISALAAAHGIMGIMGCSPLNNIT
jgi:hypothetical protein